ncbi:hypothetical protein ACGGZK_18125 [Agromyces sp. MMS24-K17]|uniref:hypothetical protein n=1 Tax=Agromyces sp. MMS24-K17 TaxID=3372850 RepID=UPI0037544C51
MPGFDEYLNGDAAASAQRLQFVRGRAERDAAYIEPYWATFSADVATMVPHLEGRFETELVGESEWHFTVHGSGKIHEVASTRSDGIVYRNEIGDASVRIVPRGPTVSAWRFPYGFLVDGDGHLWMERNGHLQPSLVNVDPANPRQNTPVHVGASSFVKLDRPGIRRFIFAGYNADVFPTSYVNGTRLLQKESILDGRTTRLTIGGQQPEFRQLSFSTPINSNDTESSIGKIYFGYPRGWGEFFGVNSMLFQTLKEALANPAARRTLVPR